MPQIVGILGVTRQLAVGDVVQSQLEPRVDFFAPNRLTGLVLAEPLRLPGDQSARRLAKPRAFGDLLHALRNFDLRDEHPPIWSASAPTTARARQCLLGAWTWPPHRSAIRMRTDNGQIS